MHTAMRPPNPLVEPVEPTMAAVLQAVAAMPPMHVLPPAVVREIVRQQSTPPPGWPELPVAAVERYAAPGPAGDLPVRLYRPPAATGRLPLLVFLHGGGWVFGDLDSYDGVCRTLCAAAGMAVASVDYRLAPEHPFPAAPDDAEAALLWAWRNAEALGLQPQRIALAGDSAGAQLAANTALRVAGRVPLLGVGLIYPPAHPWYVPTAAKAENGEGKLLTQALLQWCAELYLGREEARGSHPEAALLCAPNLARLPPCWVATLGHDPLRDDGLALVQALTEAGVPVQHRHEPAGVHGCLTTPWVSQVGPRLLESLAGWLRGL